jgi:hypothetical protein
MPASKSVATVSFRIYRARFLPSTSASSIERVRLVVSNDGNHTSTSEYNIGRVTSYRIMTVSGAPLSTNTLLPSISYTHTYSLPLCRSLRPAPHGVPAEEHRLECGRWVLRFACPINERA